MIKQTLPWLNQNSNINGMIGKRSSVSMVQLVDGLPTEIMEICMYTQSLTYYQEPDYNWIISKFNKSKCGSRASMHHIKIRKKKKTNKSLRKRAQSAQQLLPQSSYCELIETIIASPPEFTVEFRRKLREA